MSLTYRRIVANMSSKRGGTIAEILLYLSFAMILEMGPVTEVLSGSLCRSTSTDKNFDESFALNRIAGLLLLSRRYRHWMLFMWVATNLTISAMNNYDWYNSKCNKNWGMWA